MSRENWRQYLPQNQPAVRDKQWLLERVEMIPFSGCWLWTGFLNENGYAMYAYKRGEKSIQRRAHRLAFVLWKGPIPGGLEPDHLCRVRCCVNPDHLEAVTRRENVLRGARGRLVTHCPQGHEYTPENLAKHVRRCCKTCQRDRERKRRYVRRVAL